MTDKVKCHKKECILYEPQDDNNCMEYDDVEIDCIKYKYDKLYEVAKALAADVRRLSHSDTYQSLKQWEEIK